jgi:hypothetical protein
VLLQNYSSLSGYCGGKIVHCLPIVLSIQPSTLPIDQSTQQLAFQADLLLLLSKDI